MVPNTSKFETELQVRPDDLDMNRHVHGSRYQDYVLAARYDQMARCYGLSMEAFLEAGFAWVVQSAHLDYKRPLGLGEKFTVRTWVEAFFRHGVRVRFEIIKNDRNRLACEGYFDYTMVGSQTGRAAALPDWVITKYSI